jgi:predicted RNA-binding protein
MATTIVTKYGGDAPAASDIVRGELAVDTENGRLYTENAAGAVVEIGLNPEGNIDVTGSVTADGLTNNGDVVFSKSTTGVPIIKMSGFANANSPYGIINFYTHY